MNTAYVIHASDNVAVALDDLECGEVKLLGEKLGAAVTAIESVRHGHKIALRDFQAGDAVIKCRIIIGLAKTEIKIGQWMHLHNVASRFDERSGTLDKETGEPTEEGVYV